MNKFLLFHTLMPRAVRPVPTPFLSLVSDAEKTCFTPAPRAFYTDYCDKRPELFLSAVTLAATVISGREVEAWST